MPLVHKTAAQIVLNQAREYEKVGADYAGDIEPEQIPGARVGRLQIDDKRENVIALGPSGVGKTHTLLALGLAACQKGHSVVCTTTLALVHERMEALDEKLLRALQKQLTSINFLSVDELGYVPFTAIGAELLFKIFSRRYEHGATLLTSNLPFDQWTSVLGSEWLTSALLERPTHQVPTS